MKGRAVRREASGIRQVRRAACQVPSKVGVWQQWKPMLRSAELSLILRSQQYWSPALWIVADSWVLWIREEQRQNARSSEVATHLNSSELQDRKEWHAASVAQAAHWFAEPDIPDQMLAAFHEMEATVDHDRPPVSGRGFLSHENVHRGMPYRDWILVQPILAHVPTPIVDQNHEIGFLNASIVARNRLLSSHAPSHKTDRSTDRAQCSRMSQVLVRRLVW